MNRDPRLARHRTKLQKGEFLWVIRVTSLFFGLSMSLRSCISLVDVGFKSAAIWCLKMVTLRDRNKTLIELKISSASIAMTLSKGNPATHTHLSQALVGREMSICTHSEGNWTVQTETQPWNRKNVLICSLRSQTASPFLPWNELKTTDWAGGFKAVCLPGSSLATQINEWPFRRHCCLERGANEHKGITKQRCHTGSGEGVFPQSVLLPNLSNSSQTPSLYAFLL